METKILPALGKVKKGNAGEDGAEGDGGEDWLREAVGLLKDGNVVAFPTETVYGLGANALSARAVEGIFKAKGRPSDNPLIVHVSSLEMLESLIAPKKIPLIYLDIIAKFWPGALTILLEKPESIPNVVTAGQQTVAIRMPSHPVALKLIEACGFPLAAPSANTSGRPSPTLACHVFDDLSGRIPLIIDGGSCISGVESTVLDGLRIPPCILRPGGVTTEMLIPYLVEQKLQVYKKDFTDKKLEEAPTTPGMKYRHYTPNCKVILFEATSKAIDLIKQEYDNIITSSPDRSAKIGILLTGKMELLSSQAYPLQLSLGETPKEIAQSVFLKLREMEHYGVDYILIQGITEEDEGLAVMNRLRKAASKIL